VSGVVKGLRRMATEHDLRGTQLKEITTVCNYFENNGCNRVSGGAAGSL